MELIEAMKSVGGCRYYKKDPVPDDVLYQALDAARFGPQGGNRQPVRFLIVRDEDKKKQLNEWYLIPWKQYMASIGGDVRIGHAGAEKAIRDADHYAEHMWEIPAIVVVLARLEDIHYTDLELDRPSVMGGASVFPVVQNFCLALRDQGVANNVTTLLCHFEPQVKELLAIPDEYATCCHLTIGYPEKGFPKKLTRDPVESFAFVDSLDTPLTAGNAATV